MTLALTDTHTGFTSTEGSFEPRRVLVVPPGVRQSELHLLDPARSLGVPDELMSSSIINLS